MVCTNIDPIHNCSKCIFTCTDTVVLSTTTNLTIARIASNILWMNTFINSPIHDRAEYTVNISCTGSVEISKKHKTTVLGNNVAIDICRELLTTWYKINNSTMDKKCGEIIYKTIQVIGASNDINKVRQETIKLAKYIEKVSMGDRITDIIVFPSIKTEKTCFKLSDIDLVSRLTAAALTGILASIIKHIRYLQISTGFIDPEVCYVTYAGELAISPNLKFTNCNIKVTKAVYSQYLNAWCKNNFTKCSEIKKIKKSIDISNRSQNLDQLYDNCTNLLNVLEH